MRFAPGTDTLRPGFTRCAREGGTCAVAYGAGTYTYKTATGSTACTSVSVGGAPAANIMKSFSVAPVGNPAGSWAKCTSQNGTCPTVEGQPVVYGAYGAVSTITGSVGTATRRHRIWVRAAAATDAPAGHVPSCETPASGMVVVPIKRLTSCTATKMKQIP